MRIVVTGGGGFIGARLVRELATTGREVFTLSRSPGGPNYAAGHGQFSVQSPGARQYAAQFDVIVHLAGLADASSSNRMPYAYADLHSDGALNMLEAARQGGALFILASTARVYESSPLPLSEDNQLHPPDVYGYSKLVAETWVNMYRELYALPTAVVRLFSVYGPGQMIVAGTSGVVSILTRRAIAGEDMHVREKVVRDFTYVDDVARGIAQLISAPSAYGAVYNLATGAGTSLETLAEYIRKVTHSKSPIIIDPATDCDLYVADISRANHAFGYCPQTNLVDGLAEYAKWRQSFP
jgi:UDP-glucose 4-epimerase